MQETIGGISTLAAINHLAADPATRLIVIVTKPPARSVDARVRAALERSQVPGLMALLATGAGDLTSVAADIARRLGVSPSKPRTWLPPRAPCHGPATARALLRWESVRRGGRGNARELGVVASNVTADGVRHCDARGTGVAEHLLLDFGDDELTRGRPHPMIDQRPRLARLKQTAVEPSCGVVLLDVVLGTGAHRDPALELAPAIATARRHAAGEGRQLAFVVSLCGAERDPQGRESQGRALFEAGADVLCSNAAAARRAGPPPGCSAIARRELLRVSARGTPPLHHLVLEAPRVAAAGAPLLADALDAQQLEVTRVAWSPPVSALPALTRVAADPRTLSSNQRAVAHMRGASTPCRDPTGDRRGARARLAYVPPRGTSAFMA